MHSAEKYQGWILLTLSEHSLERKHKKWHLLFHLEIFMGFWPICQYTWLIDYFFSLAIMLEDREANPFGASFSTALYIGCQVESRRDSCYHLSKSVVWNLYMYLCTSTVFQHMCLNLVSEFIIGLSNMWPGFQKYWPLRHLVISV